MQGVVESAVVGASDGAVERVHAVLVLDPGTDAETVVREANAQLADHQRIRSFSIWTDGPLAAHRGHEEAEARGDQGVGRVRRVRRRPRAPSDDPLQALLAKFAGGRALDGGTSIEGLGLSSLERVELMVALEDQFQTRIDETKFAGAKTLDELRTLLAAAPEQAEVAGAGRLPVVEPRPGRCASSGASASSPGSCRSPGSSRGCASSGLEHLDHVSGPVVFAANHQSHFDVPVILTALPGAWRERVAPAMSKEFFKAHFFPEGFTRWQVFTNRLNYYLVGVLLQHVSRCRSAKRARGRRCATSAR